MNLLLLKTILSFIKRYLQNFYLIDDAMLQNEITYPTMIDDNDLGYFNNFS